MGESRALPGHVASVLVELGVTAWELDVATNVVEHCGAVGGAGGGHRQLADFQAALHPADRPRVVAAMAALIAGATDEQLVEYRVADGDGWSWRESSYRALARDPARRAARVVGVTRDIHNRRRIEQELRDVEARLRSYIRHGGEPVWCFEPATPVPLDRPVTEQVERLLAARLVDCNDAYLTMRGLLRPQALGRSMVDLSTSTVAELRRGVTQLVVSTYQRLDEILEAKDPAGQPRFIATRVDPVIEDGTVVRLWGSMTDVTRQRQMEHDREALEAQLQQAQRLESVGALAGGIAHDFNNLLVAIQGSAELAEAELPADAPARHDLAVIRDAAQRAAELTRKLLTFSRRQPMQRTRFSAAAVVTGLTPLLRRLLPASMRVELDVADGLPPLLGDAGTIEQAVVNLAINARDATGGHGQVRIAVDAVVLDDAACRGQAWARPGAYVRIAVTDDGPGIAAEYLDRVFDPFFSTKPVDQGTGLGLAIVYSAVVRQHAGLIEVTSGAGGTRFALYLPVDGAAQLTPTPTPATRPVAVDASGGQHILVAEDEPAVRRITVALLEEAGYRVTAVADGAAAIATYLATPDAFELVMLDAIMPALGGREVARRIRAVRPEQRLLFVSGYAAGELDADTVDHRRGWFLAKPWTMADLLRTVHAALVAP